MQTLHKVKNLQLRGRTWWVKKMIRGVLIQRSLETFNLQEAIQKMEHVVSSTLQRKTAPKSSFPSPSASDSFSSVAHPRRKKIRGS